MTETVDLFGPVAGNSQLSLFGPGDDRTEPPTRRFVPTPESVRTRLLDLLEKARRAQSMPWSERDARMWQTLFPQMANWLPDTEASQLCFDFAREIERLKAA